MGRSDFTYLQILRRKADILGELAKSCNPTKAAQIERKRTQILNLCLDVYNQRL